MLKYDLRIDNFNEYVPLPSSTRQFLDAA